MPAEFGRLASLQTLLLDGSGTKEDRSGHCRGARKFFLPAELGSLASLTHLNLHYLYVINLPEELGSLRSLTALDLGFCSYLQSLPETFGSLASLRKLDLTSCSSLTRLPATFGSLVSLEELILRDCDALSEMPDMSMLPQVQSIRRCVGHAAKHLRPWGEDKYTPCRAGTYKAPKEPPKVAGMVAGVSSCSDSPGSCGRRRA